LNRTQRAQLFAQVLVLVNNSFIKARAPCASSDDAQASWPTLSDVHHGHVHTTLFAHR
jgi:hypothetical protein